MNNEIGLENLILRSNSEGDGRTVEGIGVPFGQIIDTWSGAETFDDDCIFDGLDTAKLCYQHGELIGTITSGENRDDGLHVTARISNTQAGRDAVELLRDGALDSMSVGFIPLQSETDENGITHRKKVRLLEISLVSWPAYSGAKVTDQRKQQSTTQPAKETIMPVPDTAIQEQLDQQRSAIDANTELLRKIQTDISTSGKPESSPLEEFRSMGDMVKKLVTGDTQARAAYDSLQERAQSDTTTGMFKDTDPQPVWVADHIRLVQSHRTVTNMVTTAALPSEGMSVAYLTLKSDTTQIAKIENEGDDLKFGKIDFADASAKVEMFGGYSSVSRLVIDRSQISYLDILFRAMGIQYAKYTENATRTALYGAIDAVQDSDKLNAGKAVDKLTVNDWMDILIDAAEELDDRDIANPTLGVSKDVFKALSHLELGDRMLMSLSGNQLNQVGSIDLTGVSGRIASFNVQLMPKSTPGTASFVSKDAVTMWEAGNAPFQLQADRVLDLGRDMSLYGYAAHGVTNAAGIIPIKFGA